LRGTYQMPAGARAWEPSGVNDERPVQIRREAMRRQGKIAAITVAFTLVVSACGGGLGAVAVSSFEPSIDSIDALAARTDAIIDGRLIEVIGRVRYTSDDEGVAAEGERDEFVGLVFKVQDVLSGDFATKEITVQWMGYKVQAESKVREYQLRINGIDMLDPDLIGREFVFAVTFVPSIDAYQITSTAAIASVGADGTLTGLADGRNLGDLGAGTIDELKSTLGTRP